MGAPAASGVLPIIRMLAPSWSIVSIKLVAIPKSGGSVETWSMLEFCLPRVASKH
jgi:hypothetical protein